MGILAGRWHIGFAANRVFPLAVLCGCRFDSGLAREVTLRFLPGFLIRAGFEGSGQNMLSWAF